MAVKIRERNGRWWLFVDWHGQRKAKCFQTKEAADSVRIALEARLVLGADTIFEPAKKAEPPPPPLLFGDFCRQWLDTYVRIACKKFTWIAYDADFRLYLEPVFGKVALADVTRETIIQKLLHPLLTQEAPIEEKATATRGERRRRRVSRSTVKNVLAALRGCLNYAVENGKLASNPAVRFGRVLREHDSLEERQADFLTADELSVLLAACREHKPRYFPFILTLARTGMRRGEAAALNWGDVDFHGGFIQVVRGSGGSPKSRKARRVDMSAGLAEILKHELVKARESALEAGKPLREWVFTDPQGGRLKAENFAQRVWHPLLLKAGLRRIRLHDLRHTYASLLIQDGWPLKYIQEQLGHSSISITSDVYGHLVPGANRAAADRLDELAPPIAPQADAIPAQLDRLRGEPGEENPWKTGLKTERPELESTTSS